MIIMKFKRVNSDFIIMKIIYFIINALDLIIFQMIFIIIE